MKINVTVDLEEFYPEGEGDNLSEQIKSAIAHVVKMDVLKMFRESAGDVFSQQVKEEISA